MQASRRITRKSASNLALALILLPKAKRAAMSALYAFCRQVDDVADEDDRSVDERRASLQEWREDVKVACDNRQPRFPVNQELQPVIARYGLPFALFEELLRGVEMDLDVTSYATYDDLELYCHRVASVVGLLSLEVFGYRDPACRDYAVALGRALQFTNILRDVYCDAQRGRIYLPQEAMARHGVSPAQIHQGQFSTAYQGLAREVAERAQGHYRTARMVLPATERRSMVAAELMGAVYWRLLRKLEQRQFNVFGPDPIRLGKIPKLILIGGTWIRVICRNSPSSYGE